MVKTRGRCFLSPEVSDGSLCMEGKPASRECCPSAVGLLLADCVHPTWMCRRLVPKRRAVCAARGTAGHLQHRGSTSGTREPHVSAEQAKPGKPPSPATSHVRGGASVVVRTRESRVHGEGRQSTSTASKPQGKAMYVATSSDKDWLLSKQQKPYARSYDKTPDFASTSMESPVHSERCTPGSERGARKPIGASR